MFAVPIDQSGLAGFVPVQRQTGSSVGRNIFGQEIEGLPSLTDRRNLAANQALDIGGTDIGGIPKPVKFFPGVDIDQHGIDPDADPPGVPTEGQETSTADINIAGLNEGLQSLPESVSENISKATSFVSDVFNEDKYSYNPEEGLWGTAEIAGKSYDVASKGASLLTSGLLATTKAAPFASLFGDIVEGIVSGKGLNATNVAFSIGKIAASFIAPPLVPLISLVQLFTSLFGDDDDDTGTGGLGSTPGDPTDAAMAGLGIGFGQGGEDGYDDPYGDPTIDEYGDFGTIGDINAAIAAAKAAQQAEDFAAATSGPGGFGDTGQMGGPTGSGGIDSGEGTDGDADGSDDGADGDADACWVAGTQVLMGDCTYRNIEDLKIGDVVMSFPEDKKTRKWTTELEAKPIISLSVNRSRNIWHLNDTMVTGREWIVKGDGTAALVMWLQEGDTVMGADGEPIDIYRVEAAEGPLSSQITYTFETQNNFSYTADNFRTLRGRAVRAPEDWVYAKDVPTGSMQDEYNKKFSKLAA